MTRTLLPLVLIALAFDAGALPVRRTVVLTVGEGITYEASAPISTHTGASGCSRWEIPL